MSKHRKAKATCPPPQALFDDDVEDVASQEDATSFLNSAAEALAVERPPALAAAVEQATFEREERAILGNDAAQEAEPEPAESALDDEDLEQGLGSGDDVDQPAAEAGPAQEASYATSSMKNRDAMSSVALVFLEDATARRLAVAWEVCGGSEDDWFDAAGFTTKQHVEARRIGRALRLHGVCRDGGITDKLAIDYISAVIARPLTAATKKKP